MLPRFFLQRWTNPKSVGTDSIFRPKTRSRDRKIAKLKKKKIRKKIVYLTCTDRYCSTHKKHLACAFFSDFINHSKKSRKLNNNVMNIINVFFLLENRSNTESNLEFIFEKGRTHRADLVQKRTFGSIHLFFLSLAFCHKYFVQIICFLRLRRRNVYEVSEAQCSVVRVQSANAAVDAVVINAAPPAPRHVGATRRNA